eukprot:TRINITY_DN24186_c0_g1_i1.p1 TRINITY_DN24186_c0_g1~~TRINITY_DN24186_c0_g1_i1.p1  ORF type:complete len:400 (+),score=88.62 TRINITY_DN24186_c0_g1_i1:57-1256(+)
MRAGDAAAFALVGLFFLIGTSNTIVTKVIFTLDGKGADGSMKPFHKPAFGNWNMFFGMVLVLLEYFRRRCRRQPLQDPASAASLLSAEGGGKAMKEHEQWCLIAVPALFDMMGTGLSLVGIILIPASIWQMLRGAEIIFASLLTVFALRRRLYAFHWLGVSLAFLGIIFVSVATILNGAEDDSAPGSAHSLAVGVAVTIASQMVQAAQIIAEERLLVDLDMDPVLVVGVEGAWGLLVMTAVVYPLLWLIPGQDSGSLENPVDTADMISSSSAILFFVVMDFVSCAVYNVLGQHVTKTMSGMMRVMLESTRTLFVWLFNLSWYYLVSKDSPFGESWTRWSYFEALGFVLLVLGQMTYGELLRWPKLYYPPQQVMFASPSPIRAKGGIAAFASPSGNPSSL